VLQRGFDVRVVDSSSLRTGRAGDAGFRQGRLEKGGKAAAGKHRDAPVQGLESMGALGALPCTPSPSAQASGVSVHRRSIDISPTRVAVALRDCTTVTAHSHWHRCTAAPTYTHLPLRSLSSTPRPSPSHAWHSRHPSDGSLPLVGWPLNREMSGLIFISNARGGPAGCSLHVRWW
jgi:hypothetical protein